MRSVWHKIGYMVCVNGASRGEVERQGGIISFLSPFLVDELCDKWMGSYIFW